MDIKTFVSTIYLGDRACKKIIIDTWYLITYTYNYIIPSIISNHHIVLYIPTGIAYQVYTLHIDSIDSLALYSEKRVHVNSILYLTFLTD